MQTKIFLEGEKNCLLFPWISLSEVLFSSRTPIPYWRMNVVKVFLKCKARVSSPASCYSVSDCFLPITDLIQSISFTFITYSASFLRLAEPSSTCKVLLCFWGPRRGQRPSWAARVHGDRAMPSSPCCVRQLLTLPFQRLEIFLLPELVM